MALFLYTQSPYHKIMEDWKEIKGYPGYYVHKTGFVFSEYSNKFLKQCWVGPKYKQYLAVNLHRNGKRKKRKIHQLVLEAFVSPRPKGMFALHKDDNSANNTLENLYWGTPAENGRDRHKNHKGQHKSVYLNVYRHPQHKKWHANIYVNGKTKHIGLFDNEIDAAKAYDAYILKNHLNRPTNFVY